MGFIFSLIEKQKHNCTCKLLLLKKQDTIFISASLDHQNKGTKFQGTHVNSLKGVPKCWNYSVLGISLNPQWYENCHSVVFPRGQLSVTLLNEGHRDLIKYSSGSVLFELAVDEETQTKKRTNTEAGASLIVVP